MVKKISQLKWAECQRTKDQISGFALNMCVRQNNWNESGSVFTKNLKKKKLQKQLVWKYIQKIIQKETGEGGRKGKREKERETKEKENFLSNN